MTAKRLPSFNDFSPEILKGDLRPCLRVVAELAPDDAAIIDRWAVAYFGGKKNKRSLTNIPATLSSTGLVESGVRPLKLTDFGRSVLDSKTAAEAAQTFCKKIVEQQNGEVLLRAIRDLRGRGVAVTKASLKRELIRNGISDLSTNTTDHTTLVNWMRVAGIITGTKKSQPEIDDAVLKKLTGISSTEQDDLDGLTPPQQVFLQALRKRHEIESGPFLGQELLKACLATHPHLFDEGQFAKDVRIPLEQQQWITVTSLATGPQGGKSGRIAGTPKLLGIPIDKLIPDFSQVVPAHLRKRIRTPLPEILQMLGDADKHKRGLGLELLALRMILDLNLDPRAFRELSKDTGFAEVDVSAEGAHLVFSRWTFQCKNLPDKTRVGLGDVAKEVGVAIYMKAHVIAMVTTSDFTPQAYVYAREITQATHMQFVFVPGNVVRKYLRGGPAVLWEHVLANAKAVMMEKRRSQPVAIAPPKE